MSTCFPCNFRRLIKVNVMYTKQEISRQKQAFWTAFGKYMKPILSADGEMISWSNYKTRVPGISFKLDADHQTASVMVEVSATDAGLQQRLYRHLLGQRPILAEALGGDDWQWQSQTMDEYGRPVSRVRQDLQGVSVMRTEDWPAIISFFKPRVIGLDEYWSMARFSFQALL